MTVRSALNCPTARSSKCELATLQLCARPFRVNENTVSGKRIVISTFGSFGDIHPYVAIALELKARGHRPSIATSEVYREKMDALGIEFHPVRPDMPSVDQPNEVARVVESVMDPKTGSEAVADMIIPH